MSRRVLLLAGVSVLVGACQMRAGFTENRGGPRVQASASQPRLVYLSADNCIPCLRWDREVGAEFERSPERQRIIFSQVHFSTFRSYRIRDAWPEDQRGIYDQLIAANSNFVSPHFVLMQGERMVAWGGGTRSWHQTIMPAMRGMLSA